MRRKQCSLFVRIPWTFLFFNVVLWVALFYPIFFNGRQFCFRDDIHFHLPLAHYVQNEWNAGRVPLLTPHDNLGQPLLANPAAAVLYPGKLIFLLPFDFYTNYNLYVTVHVLLAAATMYRLARRWNRSVGAATLASLAYAFGGAVFGQFGNVIYLVGAAWVPEAILWADRMLTRRNLVDAFRFSIVLALMVLGGDPQAAYHVGLFATIFAVYRRLRERRLHRKPAPLLAKGSSSLARNRFVLLAVAALGSFLLAAVQFLPSMEFSRLCDRSSFDKPRSVWEVPACLLAKEKDSSSNEIPLGNLGFADDKPVRKATLSPWQKIRDGLFRSNLDEMHHQAFTYKFSVHPLHLCCFFWTVYGGVYWPQFATWTSDIVSLELWTLTAYVGIVPCLLALSVFRLSFGKNENVRIAWLSLFLLLTLLGSLGKFGFGWVLATMFGLPTDTTGIMDHVGGVYWFFQMFIPGYVQFRYPAKLLTLATFPFAMLAAYGWDALFTAADAANKSAKRMAVRFRRFSWFFIGTSLLLALWASNHGVWAALDSQMLSEVIAGPLLPELGRKIVTETLLQTACVLAATLLLLRWKSGPWKNVAVLSLLALTIADLFVSDRLQLVLADRQAVRSATSPIGDRIIASTTIAPPRYMHFEATFPSYWLEVSSPDRFTEKFVMDRARLSHQLNYMVPCNSFDIGGSSRLVAFSEWRYHNVCRDEHFEKNLAAVDVGYVLMPKEMPLFDDLAERVTLNAAESESLVGMVLWKLKHPQGRVRFDGRELEEGKESCRVTIYEPQRVVVETTLSRPTTVVLKEQYYPGWTVRIETLSDDGEHVLSTQPGTILPIQKVFRGVELPEGRFRLTFLYVPASFRCGAILSFCGWTLVLSVLVCYCFIKKPRRFHSDRS